MAGPVCWLPRIQPTRTPKQANDTAVMSVSGFMQARTATRPPLRSYSGDRGEVLSHGSIEPHPQGPADERVADRHLSEVRQRTEQRQVLHVEVLTGVDAKAETVGETRSRGVAIEAGATRLGAEREGLGKRLGVKLDPIGSGFRGPPHRLDGRIDEQTHANTARLEPSHDGTDRRRRIRRPAGLAGDLAARHGHERALVRPDGQHEIEQVLARIAFDIELDAPLARPSGRALAGTSGDGGCAD